MNLLPKKLCWPSVQQGTTYFATRFQESLSSTVLSRVRVKVKDTDGTELLDLDSDASGITITTTTAGAWDFTIDEISAATMETMPVGEHLYDMKVTDAGGIVSYDFYGTWEITAQQTDNA